MKYIVYKLTPWNCTKEYFILSRAIVSVTDTRPYIYEYLQEALNDERQTKCWLEESVVQAKEGALPPGLYRFVSRYCARFHHERLYLENVHGERKKHWLLRKREEHEEKQPADVVYLGIEAHTAHITETPEALIRRRIKSLLRAGPEVLLKVEAALPVSPCESGGLTP